MRHLRGLLVVAILLGSLAGGPAQAASSCNDPIEEPTCLVEVVDFLDPCLEGSPTQAPGCTLGAFTTWCNETVCYAISKIAERIISPCLEDIVACLSIGE